MDAIKTSFEKVFADKDTNFFDRFVALLNIHVTRFIFTVNGKTFHDKRVWEPFINLSKEFTPWYEDLFASCQDLKTFRTNWLSGRAMATNIDNCDALRANGPLTNLAVVSMLLAPANDTPDAAYSDRKYRKNSHHKWVNRGGQINKAIFFSEEDYLKKIPSVNGKTVENATKAIWENQSFPITFLSPDDTGMVLKDLVAKLVVEEAPPKAIGEALMCNNPLLSELICLSPIAKSLSSDSRDECMRNCINIRAATSVYYLLRDLRLDPRPFVKLACEKKATTCLLILLIFATQEPYCDAPEDIFDLDMPDEFRRLYYELLVPSRTMFNNENSVINAKNLKLFLPPSMFYHIEEMKKGYPKTGEVPPGVVEMLPNRSLIPPSNELILGYLMSVAIEKKNRADLAYLIEAFPRGREILSFRPTGKVERWSEDVGFLYNNEFHEFIKRKDWPIKILNERWKDKNASRGARSDFIAFLTNLIVNHRLVIYTPFLMTDAEEKNFGDLDYKEYFAFLRTMEHDLALALELPRTFDPMEMENRIRELCDLPLEKKEDMDVDE